MSEPQATTFVLDTWDGFPVVVHRWEPQGEPRAVVNLIHGMAEHAMRYEPVARALTGAGIAVYAEDHRGHGASARTAEELGHFGDERGWVSVLDDLHRVTLRAREDHPRAPVFLLGQSLGAIFAQQYLFTFPEEVDGVVLFAADGPPGLLPEVGSVLGRVERWRLGPRGRSRLLHSLVFGAYSRRFAPARTEFDWLSRDEEAVDRYLADPRCGFVPTTQFYLDLAAGARVASQLHRVRAGARPDTPVYIAAGSEDPLGGAAGVPRLVAQYVAAGFTSVESRIYEGARHELFNELGRDEVIADLLGWFDRRLGTVAAA